VSLNVNLADPLAHPRQRAVPDRLRHPAAPAGLAAARVQPLSRLVTLAGHGGAAERRCRLRLDAMGAHQSVLRLVPSCSATARNRRPARPLQSTRRIQNHIADLRCCRRLDRRSLAFFDLAHGFWSNRREGAAFAHERLRAKSKCIAFQILLAFCATLLADFSRRQATLVMTLCFLGLWVRCFTRRVLSRCPW